MPIGCSPMSICRRGYATAVWGATVYLYGPLFGRLVVVVFTVRGDVIRILSMRKANQREQRSYDQKRSEADRRHDG